MTSKKIDWMTIVGFSLLIVGMGFMSFATTTFRLLYGFISVCIGVVILLKVLKEEK